MPSFVKRLQSLFTLHGTVDRVTYFLVGFVLMVFKYLVEAGLVLRTTGKFFHPDDFLNPWVNAREQFLDGAPEWFGPAWAIWTLPFVWIALAMTVRRARDAGQSPWRAWLILVPVVNFLAMIAFSFYPTAPEPAVQEMLAEVRTQRRHADASAFGSAVMGGLIGFAYAFAVSMASIYLADSYGAALFFGVPVISSAASAYIYNRRVDQGWGATLGVAMIPMAMMAVTLIIFALEGVICILMALPIFLPLGLLGGFFGKIIANSESSKRSMDRHMWGCLIVLPVFGWLETLAPAPRELIVTTSVEIAAPAEEVWDLVVDFPPITSPEPWYFRGRIASPREATIEGSGVGATRYCKFTTGEFVEPITVWDEPRRLAFDVTEQPEPMFELTPYRHVHPPHLQGAFRSTRGEFRLIAQSNGTTRLEGRTWYTIDMQPAGYWTIWTDAIVHRIHLRVLDHIKTLAETDSAG